MFTITFLLSVKTDSLRERSFGYYSNIFPRRPKVSPQIKCDGGGGQNGPYSQAKDGRGMRIVNRLYRQGYLKLCDEKMEMGAKVSIRFGQ